ncbi:hypothetical protein KBY85_15610 [Cyanobium sp. BA5m-10]|uniref:hypothetical protein n=1 Tax=Cyanobium sp. BA5m-10 TaxID=2823705 RepID=UPI0020CE118A|nr:hypothetical protein [Cyanobium sp. BA5m-10]MCP9905550.1 hypothetical protein [Cyanobium sp. BA5m-10]
MQVTVRATPEERAWFLHVASAQQITLSDLVRQSIAIEGARLGIPAPAAPVAA